MCQNSTYKECTTCHKNLTTDNFYLNKSRGRLRGPCKKCDIEAAKRWRKKNPKAQALINRRARLKMKYNLALEDVPTEGQCPICLNTKKLVVDHCHTGGQVRGFICYNCNTLLGHIENEEKMNRIRNYLNVPEA